MFTKNWYKAMFVEMTRDSNVYFQNVNGDTTRKIMTNSWLYTLCQDTSSRCVFTLYKVQPDFNTNDGVVFGTGNEAPTIDDYKLSGELIPTHFTYSAAINKTIDDSGCVISALYTITNSGTEPITIGEVALMGAFHNYSGASYKGLVERTALETPITIPGGGLGQVEYTIRIPFPTA